MPSSQITWVSITLFDDVMTKLGYDPAEDEYLHQELSEMLTYLNVHLGQRPMMMFRPCKTFLLFRLNLPDTAEARELIDYLVATVDHLVAGWTVNATVFCNEKGPAKGLTNLCGLEGAEKIEPIRRRHLKQLVEFQENGEDVVEEVVSEVDVDDEVQCVPV